ncbi:vWA domain-containing protein [Ancylobacter terrae]|uniref:vWA domain-containing protein n=1 Tax=Ancylobacter sp. sgz301288 TaxID=3342077 RepID=UPI00385F07BC
MSPAPAAAFRPGGDGRLWLLVVAFVALVAALLAPRITLPREARDVLLVIDVTGSMNVRDASPSGAPLSRLAAARQAGRALLANLPCQSRLGLGIFTERRTFLLFEPAEVCENFAAIDGAIDALDWRMAWEGDSYVARGIHSGIAIAASLHSDLVFLTDGHEAPPLAGGTLPSFDGKADEVAGLLLGVGSVDPSPIPKFDDDGREVGFYAENDVPQENRSGPPPADAPSRAGWNPRNAPWGGEAASGTEHLSALREAHLRALAGQTGLHYARLADPRTVGGLVAQATRPRPVSARVDTAFIPATLALCALATLYATGVATRRRSPILD